MEIQTHQAAGGGGGDEKICKKVSGDNNLQYCDKHFTDFSTKNPCLITPNKMKKDTEKKNLPPDEQFCSYRGSRGTWRCKNIRMSHGGAAADVPRYKHCEKHYNYYVEVTKKKKLLKKRSRDGEGAGSIEIRDSNFSKLRKKVMEEHDPSLGIQPPDASDNTSNRIGRKRESVERTERSEEVEALAGIGEPTVELESLEHYKSKCFELSVDLEKKKVECTTLHGKLAEVEGTRKTAGTDESERTPPEATECWRKQFTDMIGCVQSRISELQSLVLRLENKISAMAGFVETRFSKLESLVLESGKESSILRCVELHDSEKIESGARDKEMKWKCEADMLSSFEEDPELCLKAVCALYRQHISKDEMSDKGWFHNSDVLRCTTLAKFLMDEDCKGGLNKSVKELEIFDSKAADDCKMLARRYSTQLFSIYQNRKDPLFLPATTASHGDETV